MELLIEDKNLYKNDFSLFHYMRFAQCMSTCRFRSVLTLTRSNLSFADYLLSHVH